MRDSARHHGRRGGGGGDGADPSWVQGLRGVQGWRAGARIVREGLRVVRALAWGGGALSWLGLSV